MAKYIIAGAAKVSLDIEIEADSLEEAMHKALCIRPNRLPKAAFLLGSDGLGVWGLSSLQLRELSICAEGHKKIGE